MLETDWLGHRVGLLARRHAVFPEPDVLGRLTLLEEQEISPDRCVRFEHGIGQANNGVEVALVEERFLDTRFHTFAKEGAIGKDKAGAAAGLEQLHEQHEEEIGCLACAELGGKICLNAVFRIFPVAFLGKAGISTTFRGTL